jgi:hypothetical protein
VSMTLQVAMDCADPHAQCNFWAQAMGYEVEQHEEGIREMIAAGHATDDDTTEYEGHLVWRTGAACRDPEGKRSRFFFQLVPEPKTAKNRVHVDLQFGPEHRDAEVERLTGLGAKRLYEESQGPHTWVTMADPEGNEFCVS